MKVDPIEQFQIELFKQVLDMLKETNRQIVQQVQNSDYKSIPPKNPNGNISIYA